MRAEDVSSPYAKSYVFKLIHFSPDKRTWYFATASEREMQLWMATIKSELEKMSNNGHVSHLTQKLVIGLKRPSFRASEVSDFDDDDIYKDIETAVVYDYNDIDDSGADESDSDYESPVEEAEDSIGNRPLPPTPADSSSNSSPMSRPPAQIPAAEKTWKPPGGVSCGFHMGGMNELKNRQMDMNDKKNSNEVSFGVKSKLQNAWPPLPTPPTSKPKIPSSTKPAIPIKNVGGPPKPAPRPRQSSLQLQIYCQPRLCSILQIKWNQKGV
ncbi:uncharacterized protein LOC102808716 [Saccoglossus kowalevskii]|uniref:SH3 domain-binding protein 2-like n=1 Tax=Saccoglossus kowalevskii TaxID=10224 RepID=A0ABM0MCU0_SACKO|nr:PREDICTED: SH3 domain-binding protein 2-like [Saccoglossus kowalevskii]